MKGELHRTATQIVRTAEGMTVGPCKSLFLGPPWLPSYTVTKSATCPANGCKTRIYDTTLDIRSSVPEGVFEFFSMGTGY